MISLGDGVEVDDVDALAVHVQSLLTHLDEGRELSIRITDDDEVRALNLGYRHRDAATDVLSFPQDAPLLGDIVISIDTARRQAAERGHGLDVELRVLVVHGLAHLLGHDHYGAEETRLMRQVEADWLARIGVQAKGLVEQAHG